MLKVTCKLKLYYNGFCIRHNKGTISWKVLLNPTPELYHQYWYDDMIVIGKLVSEAPMGQTEKWHTRLEKLLVDLMTDSILLSSVSESEFKTIYEDAFSKYAIDERCMFRYAKRRAADKRIYKQPDKHQIENGVNITRRLIKT